MVYFDNAATTYPKPEEVYEALDTCARNYAVNVGRGQYDLSDTASIVVSETRLQLLTLFHSLSSQVIFSPSATIAANQILRGLDFSKIHNVYISPFEHNAVVRTLNYLQKEYNFTINYLSVALRPFAFDLNIIEKDFAINKPDLIILNHASNVCGCVSPASDIFDLSKKSGAINILDTAQTAGIIDIFYDDWQVDYLIFAGHKGLYGPLGVAGFLMKDNFKSLKPLITGGSGFDSINKFMPTQLPSRYEAGSLNINSIAGLNSSLKILNSNEISIRRDNELKLLLYFEEFIEQNFPEFEIIGKNYLGERVAVSSLIHEEYSPDEIGLILNKYGFAVRTGMHCAPLAHAFLGTSPAGTARFSFGIFNTKEEIDLLIKLKEFL
jgi:cysteine desulfurase family protein